MPFRSESQSLGLNWFQFLSVLPMLAVVSLLYWDQGSSSVLADLGP